MSCTSNGVIEAMCCSAALGMTVEHEAKPCTVLGCWKDAIPGGILCDYHFIEDYNNKPEQQKLNRILMASYPPFESTGFMFKEREAVPLDDARRTSCGFSPSVCGKLAEGSCDHLRSNHDKASSSQRGDCPEQP